MVEIEEAGLAMVVVMVVMVTCEVALSVLYDCSFFSQEEKQVWGHFFSLLHSIVMKLLVAVLLMLMILTMVMMMMVWQDWPGGPEDVWWWPPGETSGGQTRSEQ